MIRSMTAFSRQEHPCLHGRLVWEIRSVNHRYLDISIRLPEEFRSLEQAVRDAVSAKLNRGKVECHLKYTAGHELSPGFTLNSELANKLIEACTSLSTQMPAFQPVSPLELLKYPGVMAKEEPNLEPLFESALSALDSALAHLIASRESEGLRMAELIRERAATIASLIEEVALQRPEVLKKIREKLLNRLQDFQKEVQVDSHRLEQEMVFAAQRLDVDEELDRLRSHLQELEQILRAPEPVGRKLDFLMQEFNREANTLSSKSADATTTRCAVEMKVLIEQMREQVQNIE
jgi:uncharacterized protein (TIGR00255 family)